MKLEKYIKQLLQDNEMVIVPGFGAFISEYIPAVVDEASGEIKPPSSKLVFNSKIKNNDGLLVGQVAEATRCTHFEALQKIEKERDNIIYQLDKGEKVELLEIGVLFYNTEKQVTLVSEEDADLSLDNFGLESTHIEAPTEPETEEIPEEPVSKVEETPSEAELEAVEEAEENVNETAVSQEESEPDFPVEEPEKTGIVEETKENTTKEIVAESVYASFEKKENRKKGGWIWLLVILIPLLAVSVFIYTKQHKPEKPAMEVQQPEAKTTVPETLPKEEPLALDSITPEIKDTTIAVEVPETEQTAEIVSGKFYLVGGSFKEEENAETFLQTLKEKGFEPFQMGKYGNFFIVGIGRYDTEDEAMTAKDEYLEQNPGSGVWILER